MNDITDVIRARKSVRTYDGQPLTAQARAQAQALIAEAGNPFGVPVRLHLLEAGETAE